VAAHLAGGPTGLPVSRSFLSPTFVLYKSFHVL